MVTTFYKKQFVFIIQILAVGIGLSLSLYASENSTAKKFKLKDLIQEALENNLEGQAVKQEALSQKAQIGPMGAYEDPMLAFEAKDYPVNTLSPNQFGMTGNEVSVTQRVPFPGKLTKLRSATRKEYESKESAVHQKELQITTDVKRVYYELFLAYKKHDILGEQKNLLKQLVAVARSKYSVGKIPQAELLGFQIEQGKILGEILESEKEIKTKNAALNYVLGRKETWVQGKPEDIIKTPFERLKLNQGNALDKALQKNFNLKSAQFMLESAADKSTYAKLTYLPDFELMGGYTFRQPSPGDPGTDFVSAKIGATIPLWFLSKQSELVKSASAEKAKAEAMLQEERVRLIQEVRTHYAELIQAQQSLDLYENGILPLARQAVVAGKSSYLTGRLEYISLLSLINSRFQTEYATNQALVNYETKISELEVLLGGSIEEKQGEKP